MDKHYSRQAIVAFLTLLATYALMVWMLTGLDSCGYVKFQTNTGGDLLPLMASLPFAALYLLVLLAATAGYARAAIVARSLPFNQILKSELEERKMDGASITTKIRSGGQVQPDTPFISAMNNITSSRVPILAVIGSDGKVTGVITDHDIMRTLQTEFEKPDPATLCQRLKDLRVKDMPPRKPVFAGINQSLQQVIQTMLRHQFTKLLVVDDKQPDTFLGTVDVMDLVGEFFDGGTGKP